MDLPVLRWSLGHGVEAVFSTAADGDQRLQTLRQSWSSPLIGGRRLVVPRQVHGTLVVDEWANDARLALADGIVAVEPDVAIGAYGADCPGLVIATPDAVAVAHCGWRGTAGHLAQRLVTATALRSFAPRSQWRAFIGPGISGPAYEIDDPVLATRKWPAEALTPSATPGRAHLDLAEVLRQDLLAAGVGAVTSAGICTAGDPRLHSFRHQGPGLVQLLLAWRV